jgi:hypothetical protein
MDQSTLKELRDKADAAASEEGAGADVRFRDLTPSEVQVGGSRIELMVFRMVNGEMRELTRNYRPDRRDLPEVIERDACELARGLLKAR